MDNCLMVCKRLLESLKIPYTRKFLTEKILAHPQYPSLLSISDTLTKYGVECVAAKLESDRLDELPLPGIVQVSFAGGAYFQVLTDVSEEKVLIFDEKGRQKELSRFDFLMSWTGVSLLIEVGEDAAEPEIFQKIRNQQIIQGLAAVCVLSFSVWVGQGLFSIHSSGLSLFYFLLKFLGLVISGILLWYEQNKENTILRKFCVDGKSADCSSILDSKSFQYLDGRITPSYLAFSYFFAGVGTLAYYGLFVTSFFAWISLAVLPVLVCSFYYQAVVIKKWCRFCLLIQGVLLLEILTVLGGPFWSAGFEISAAALFLFFLSGSILGLGWIKPLIGLQDEVYRTKRELTKVKSNRELFEASLLRSRKVKTEPLGLGIMLKGKRSKYQVTKVSNPYCSPCSRAHTALEVLYKLGNIDLRILFIPGGGDELKEKAIRHLLAVDGRGDPNLSRQALDDWYHAEKKDYGRFAARYQMNGELKQQEERVRKMEDWCRNEQIAYTPTIFIDGYELPKEYNVDDLKYILV